MPRIDSPQGGIIVAQHVSAGTAILEELEVPLGTARFCAVLADSGRKKIGDPRREFIGRL